jgi:hypothetical protein
MGIGKTRAQLIEETKRAIDLHSGDLVAIGYELNIARESALYRIHRYGLQRYLFEAKKSAEVIHSKFTPALPPGSGKTTWDLGEDGLE